MDAFSRSCLNINNRAAENWPTFSARPDPSAIWARPVQFSSFDMAYCLQSNFQARPAGHPARSQHWLALLRNGKIDRNVVLRPPLSSLTGDTLGQFFLKLKYASSQLLLGATYLAVGETIIKPIIMIICVSRDLGDYQFRQFWYRSVLIFGDSVQTVREGSFPIFQGTCS